MVQRRSLPRVDRAYSYILFRKFDAVYFGCLSVCAPWRGHWPNIRSFKKGVKEP